MWLCLECGCLGGDGWIDVVGKLVMVLVFVRKVYLFGVYGCCCE